MMSEGAKLRHDVKTINISISAQHTCFGNRYIFSSLVLVLVCEDCTQIYLL